MTATQGQGASSQRGITIVEVVVVCVLVAILALVIIESTHALSSTQTYHRTQMRVLDGADKLVRDIEWDVRFCQRIFTAATDSQDYLDSLAIPAGAVLVGSSLPVLTSHGHFDADPPMQRETGNRLFLARSIDPMEVKLPPAVGGGVVRVDLRFFVTYYLTETKDGRLDVVRWASSLLADYGTIASITDPSRRQELLLTLYEEGVTYAWDQERERAAGLHQISSAGQLSLLPRSAKLSANTYQTRPSLLVQRKLCVARNGKYGATTVPTLATTYSGDFPSGLEFKVDGPATGKLLLVRIVVRSIQDEGLSNVSEARHVFACGGS